MKAYLNPIGIYRQFESWFNFIMSSVQTKRVLVTGATGFIGRQLLLLLQHSQHTCCATIRNPGVKIDGAKEYIRLESFSRQHLKDLPTDFDAVIHLADGLSAFKQNTDIQNKQALDSKIQHTLNLAEWAKSNNAKDFIYLSYDQAMQAETEEHLFTENGDIKLKDPYAAAKRYAEIQLGRVFKSSKTRFITLRNPIVHGPGCKSNISKLLQRADSSWLKPVSTSVIYNNTVCVLNCCDAIKTALETPDAPGGTYLITDDGYHITSEEVINLFRQELGKKTGLFSIPQWFWAKATSLSARKKTMNCNSKNKHHIDKLFYKNFGWLPTQTIEQSLQNMARFYSRESK